MTRKTDSVNDMADRKARIAAEAEEVERQQSAEEARQRQITIDRDLRASESEAKRLEVQAGLIHDGETREQLLDRIRRLRDEPTSAPYVPPPPTAAQMTQIQIEQEAGRQAVARHEAMAAEVAERRKLAEEERLQREGEMHTLQHTNPGVNEQYPISTKGSNLR